MTWTVSGVPRRVFAWAASVGPFQLCLRLLALVAFWIAAMMMILGMNWYLFYFGPAPNSGQPAMNSTVTAMILPAAAWGIGFCFLFAIAYALHRGARWAARKMHSPLEYPVWHTGTFDGTLRSLLSRRSVAILMAVSTFDSLGGVAATYASPHTPQLLQLALMGCGFFAAFGITRIFVPERALRMTPVVACSMLCLVGSVVAAAVPQMRSSMKTFDVSSASAWGWLILYALQSLFPVLTNVFQSRFLVTALGGVRGATVTVDEHSQFLLGEAADGTAVSGHDRSAVIPVMDVATTASEVIKSEHFDHDDALLAEGKLVRLLATVYQYGPYRRALDRAVVCLFMLAWDTGFQVFILLALAPLDALPWFGSSPDIAATWASLKTGALCTFDRIDVCRERGTGGSFAWYTVGFFLQHFGAACVNYRLSPIFGAAAMGAVMPLNMIALWAAPSWNVFGSYNPGWAIATSTVCAILGVALQMAAHIS